MFYKNLPDESSEWILPLNVDTIISSFNFKGSHDWIHLNTIDVLSISGWNWFFKRNIHLSRRCAFFLAHPNIEGPIHIDHEFNDVAFNFVLRGHGEMQWLNIEADKYIANPVPVILPSCSSSLTVVPSSTTAHYTRFNNIKEISMLDSWRGDRGMVRIGTPHRVVTTDCQRICLSLRQSTDRFKRFDELSNVF
jgi:hypothetical protein